MGTLVFFPWLLLEKYQNFAEFKLIPYVRGIAPGGENTPIQKQIDAILSPYLLDRENSIDKATLLQVGEYDFIKNLTETERNSVFEFAELLAVCGISARSYFRLDYWNRDNFKVVIQKFKDHDFVSFQSRRKDGSTTQTYDINSYQVQMPEHVSGNWNVKIDNDLLNAHLKSSVLPGWVDYWGALIYFNLSNSDSIEIHENIEVVFAIGAFESLLRCRGKGEALANRFEETLKPTKDISIGDCLLLQGKKRFSKSNTIRHTWMRDFYNLRSKLAHGEIGHKYPMIWSSRNHLLLASYVFPLALKCCLVAKGIYQLSEEDQFQIDVFERLACHDHFTEIEKRFDPNAHPWNQAIYEARQEDMKRKMLETLNKMRFGEQE